MGKMTFVVEYEDGKEPPISSGMDILGGRVVDGSWHDYRDDFFSPEEGDIIASMIDHEAMEESISNDAANDLTAKVVLLTY